MNGNKLTRVVVLDMKNAFDIDHQILLDKPQIYNLHSNSILWSTNYLSDRYQSVRYRGAKSDEHLVETGVPQGLILGSLLFVLY